MSESESNDPLTPAADKERNSLNSGLSYLLTIRLSSSTNAMTTEHGSEKRALAFEQWFDETQETETTSEAHVFVREILPSIISIISHIAPVSECLKLRERLVSTVRATHKAFGQSLAKRTCHI